MDKKEIATIYKINSNLQIQVSYFYSEHKKKYTINVSVFNSLNYKISNELKVLYKKCVTYFVEKNNIKIKNDTLKKELYGIYSIECKE